MSGEKRSTSSVARSTISSTSNQIVNFQRRISNLTTSLTNAQNQRREDQRRFQQTLQRRENSFISSVNNLRSSMRSMEQRQASALSNQRRQVDRQIRRQGIDFQNRLLAEKNERRREMIQQRNEIQRDIDNAVGAERQERQREVRRLDNAINTERQERQREVRRLDNAINNLDQEIKKIDNELRSEIARVEHEFDEKIELERIDRQRAINSLHDWTVENLDRQRQEYLEITTRQQAEIDQARTDINSIFEQQAMNREEASAFISDLEQQIEHATQNLPHQKYVPGKLDKIRRNTANAKQDALNRGDIANARSAYFALVDLREEIVQKESEFLHWHNATLEATRALFHDIQLNREQEIEVDEGSESVEIDYWTDGQFGELETEVKEMLNRLENEQESLSLEEVQQMLNQVDQLNQREEVVLREGVERVISSQIRADMGDVIVDALENEGFVMTESGYAGDDQRNIYLVKLENRAGTEIVATVIPNDETNQNTVSINTKDARHYSEEVTRERFEGIKRVLGEAGVELGRTECYEKPIEELYDVKNILKKGGEGVPQRVLERAKLLNSQTSPKTKSK